MSGTPFSRSSSRYRSPFLDDDDDDEPFEQDPPPGLFQKTAGVAASPVLPKGDSHASTAPVDTYVRSSEARTRRQGQQARSRSRGTRDARDFSSEGVTRSPSMSPAKPSSKPKRSLRGRALAYLSRREHSRDELARKLTPFVEDSDGEDGLRVTLDRLAQEGWLSDTRFAESVVNRRAARFGTARIVGELKRHKVDSDTVQTLSQGLSDTEGERIAAVWARKFGSVAVTPQERAKQARFLASRGFSRDAIMRIIKAGDEDMLAEE